MSKDIIIDPVTKKEFDEAAQEAFETFTEAVADIDFSEMPYQAVAELFFFNGFYRGCMASIDNDDIKETLHLMSDEIKYQLKNDQD